MRAECQNWLQKVGTAVQNQGLGRSSLFLQVLLNFWLPAAASTGWRSWKKSSPMGRMSVFPFKAIKLHSFSFWFDKFNRLICGGNGNFKTTWWFCSFAGKMLKDQVTKQRGALQVDVRKPLQECLLQRRCAHVTPLDEQIC